MYFMFNIVTSIDVPRSKLQASCFCLSILRKNVFKFFRFSYLVNQMHTNCWETCFSSSYAKSTFKSKWKFCLNYSSKIIEKLCGNKKGKLGIH